jgi:membrane protein implicated in regulation of membrane protease activity
MLSNIRAEKNEYNDPHFHGIGTVIEVEPLKTSQFWQGRIKFRGSQWKAKTLSNAKLQINDLCLVVGRTSDVTLIIKPYQD